MQEVYIVLNKALYGTSIKAVVVCDNYDEASALASSINGLTCDENPDEYILKCPGLLSSQTFDINDIVSTAVVSTKSALNSVNVE